ncbi:DUF2267 domain-containing protein [Streptomyces violaceusniger]
MTRAVLHQSRDRLTVDEAVQFGAQLPMPARGIRMPAGLVTVIPA